MNTILEFCGKCAEGFGFTFTAVLALIFAPVIISLVLLACFVAVPIGIVYKIISWIIEGIKQGS